MPDDDISLLITFDISKSQTRNRLEKQLKRFGVRQLESVFLCRVPQERLHMLTGALERVRLEPTDGLVIYRLCAQCREPILRLGTVDGLPDRHAMVV